MLAIVAVATRQGRLFEQLCHGFMRVRLSRKCSSQAFEAGGDRRPGVLGRSPRAGRRASRSAAAARLRSV